MAGDTIPCECNRCGTKWNVPVKLPMGLGDFSDTVQTVKCGECGAGSDQIKLDIKMTLK